MFGQSFLVELIPTSQDSKRRIGRSSVRSEPESLIQEGQTRNVQDQDAYIHSINT